ncbi:MAG: sulfotransferase family protein [Nannocystales bacterium]
MNPTPTPHKLPLPIRALNWAGRRPAARIVPLEASALRERAVRASGLHDFGEQTQFSEGLETLCRSVEVDAGLSLAGRIAFRDYIVRSLTNRLRYVQTRAAQPEVEQVDLVPPIIVMGLPRSGTTFLHHLLACDPGARPLRLWELMEPIAGPGPDHRRRRTAKALARARWMDQTLDAKHHFDADNPEECVLLLDPSLVSASFWVFAPVHGYLQWLRAQDLHGSYELYRWYLQWFQRETPTQRLVLKAPAHTAAVQALLQAVPNALLVQTHRDPVSVVPSANSLVLSLHSLVSEGLDIERMCTSNLEHLEHLVETSELARARSKGWVDVRYADLVANPIDCVRRIYAHLELTVSEEMVEGMERHLAARPKDKYGSHAYSARGFGPSDATVRERFSAYVRDHLAD